MRKFYLMTLMFLSITINMYGIKTETETNHKTETSISDDSLDYEKLIKALIAVESQGNAKAVSLDGTCVGILQIKKIVVQDCNEYLKMKGKSLRYNYNDRFDRTKSIEMFYLEQERYRNYRRYRSKSALEHAIRLWNGGCNYTIKSTQSYFKKVMSEYNKL